MSNYLMNNPALARADWLPESLSAELDALREGHVRLVGARADAGVAAGELRRRFSLEDRKRAEALKRAYSAGEDPGEVPDPTPAEERREQQARAEEQVKAAHAALEQFVAEAVAEIKEKAPGWLGDLDGRAADAETKRREAARLLAEAEAAEEQVTVLKMWLARTARDRPGRHVPYAQLADLRANKPDDLSDIANRGVRPHEMKPAPGAATGEHGGQTIEQVRALAGEDMDVVGVTAGGQVIRADD